MLARGMDSNIERTTHRARDRGTMGSMRELMMLVAVALVLVACADDASTGCVELREPQDPASGQHVLGPGLATYQSDPPTSGPHIAGPTPSGPLDTAIDPAIQVRLLEAGGVMIQYDDTRSPAEIAALEAFGDSLVAVAPAGGTLSRPIVVTAWTWKLSCSSVDNDAVRSFIQSRPADAPGLD